MSYETEWVIRFGDVDVAGIVYYPRLFDRVIRAVEELMADVGHPIPDLIESGVGMPIVTADVDLRAPIRHGDELDVIVSTDVGESSLVCTVEFVRDGETVAEATQTMVTLDLDTFETQPITPEFRAALESV